MLCLVASSRERGPESKKKNVWMFYYNVQNYFIDDKHTCFHLQNEVPDWNSHRQLHFPSQHNHASHENSEHLYILRM